MKRKYTVSYAVIADITEEVVANSFEEALKKAKAGKGAQTDIEAIETYDGTGYLVSCNDRSIYYDEDGNIEEDSAEEEEDDE